MKRNRRLINLGGHHKDLIEYIDFGIFLLDSFQELYDKSDVSIKNKLFSSILEGELEFKDRKYRTPKFEEGHIYNNISKLGG